MAAILPAEFVSAVGITATTPWVTADELPLFEAGQTVFRLSDLPSAGSNANVVYNPWTVVNCEIKLATSATVTKILDQSLSFATPADQTTPATRSVTGWVHTTTPGSTVSSTTDSNIWFYTLRNVKTGNLVYGVHEIDLTTQANVETYIAATIGSWWV